jgi:hypothetical protein
MRRQAGRDGYAADVHRLAIGMRDPARDDVRRRQERAEHREALLQHQVGVARAAVDDVAEHAARGQRLRRQLAHQRDFVVVRLAHDDVAGGRLRQQRAPAEQALVACLGPVDVAGDGQTGPATSAPAQWP